MFNRNKELNADTAMFFDFLKDSNESLWNESKNHNKLSIVTQMFTIKLDHGQSEANYNRIIEWTRSILPKGKRRKKNLYTAKSIMKLIGVGY